MYLWTPLLVSLPAITLINLIFERFFFLGVLSKFQQPPLPIELLIQPLKKRFLYHFYGNRKTNRIDRPEWYFTQILTWIRDHQDYIGTWVQPVIEKFGLHHMDAKVIISIKKWSGALYLIC